MTEQAQAPTTPTDAQARLADLTADKSWAEKLTGGDATTRAEFDTLSRLAVSNPPPASGTIEEAAAASEKIQADKAFADFVQSTRNRFSVSDEILTQAVTLPPVSAAERDAGIAWMKRLQSDSVLSAKLMAGDGEVLRHMLSASVLINSPVRDGQNAAGFAATDLLNIGKNQTRNLSHEV